MKTWLNKNFGFSKAEFNGFLVLICIIVVLKSAPFLYDVFGKDAVDDVDVLSKLQNIELIDQQRYVYKKDGKDISPKEPNKSKLFYFDPNTIDVTGWQNLGLSKKQAQAVVNYTDKGGKFYKPEDVRKMYTISSETYKRLLPFIKIEPNKISSIQPIKPPVTSNTFNNKATVVVEINGADSLQLQQIKGIGPAFARRIIAYRNRLGGFIKKDQLLEVYGLDSTKFEEIKVQVAVDADAVEVINLNTADFEVLKRFPYLSYKQINAIIQYRKQHGNFNTSDDLSKVAILNAKTIAKMLPYFDFK